MDEPSLEYRYKNWSVDRRSSIDDVRNVGLRLSDMLFHDQRISHLYGLVRFLENFARFSEGSQCVLSISLQLETVSDFRKCRTYMKIFALTEAKDLWCNLLYLLRNV